MAAEHHAVFDALEMTRLREATFDTALESSKDRLTCVFFWGHDCPNCEVAKRMLLADVDPVKELKLTWYHVNTYEDSELGTRFGLFGIPTFLFFHQGKKLGKITPFPGIDPFLAALRELRTKYPA
ncbi:MAG: thioredoxin family protein [Bdellovibrionaceae bacterium]|nr:thioredoxin family protein [Pseudobdellovibrionaceae bacterium]